MECIGFITVLAHIGAPVHMDEAWVSLVGVQVTGAKVEGVRLKKNGLGQLLNPYVCPVVITKTLDDF